MKDQDVLSVLIHKFQEPGELSAEDQAQLQSLLSTPQGREQWVKELTFQADLLDILQTDREIENSSEQESKVIPLTTLNQKTQPAQMSSSLRMTGWVALAALLMMALFMSYYINGIPSKSNHTILGQVLSVNGEVHLNREPLNIQLVQGLAFKEGDKLMTSKNGYATFKYRDGSQISLGPNTRIAFATKKQQNFEGWKIGLEKGALDAEIQPQKGLFRFKTKGLGVEVLGTQFSIQVDAEEESIELYEGKLSVVDLKEQSSQHIITTGQGIKTISDTNQITLFELPESYWITGKIVSVHPYSKIIELETEKGKHSLRLPGHELTNLNQQENSFSLNPIFKVGQTLNLKIEGSACPRIIEAHPVDFTKN